LKRARQGLLADAGTDQYDEILGTTADVGVTMVRAQISAGDQIQIEGLSQVACPPVTTLYVTTQSSAMRAYRTSP
jgi:hypothetical protein